MFNNVGSIGIIKWLMYSVVTVLQGMLVSILPQRTLHYMMKHLMLSVITLLLNDFVNILPIINVLFTYKIVYCWLSLTNSEKFHTTK